MPNDGFVFSYAIKMLLLGAPKTGKTQLLHVITEQPFREKYSRTVGVEFGAKRITIGSNPIKFIIWDSSGEVKYKHLVTPFYASSTIIALTYDITDLQSFQYVKNYIEQQYLFHKESYFVLIGLKRDLRENRTVPLLLAHQLATKHDLLHFEVSAKTKENVDDLLNAVTRYTLDKIYKGVISPGLLAIVGDVEHVWEIQDPLPRIRSLIRNPTFSDIGFEGT